MADVKVQGTHSAFLAVRSCPPAPSDSWCCQTRIPLVVISFLTIHFLITFLLLFFTALLITAQLCGALFALQKNQLAQ